MATATAPAGRWYFGPLPDLLLGCGLAYAIFFVALSVAGPQIRDGLPMGLLPLAILVTGVQHAAYTFMWIGMGHSLQYLWVTTYYAAQSGDAPRRSATSPRRCWPAPPSGWCQACSSHPAASAACPTTQAWQ
jgi:hypothetical protein